LATVVEELGASLDGLSQEEAERRLREYGPNELVEKRKSPIVMLLSQFNNFLIFILLAATVISLFLGEYVDAALIIAIVALMGVAGFLQEYKAEAAIQALRRMVSPMAKVLRGGVVTTIPAREIVPGDVVLLEEGDRVPADARIVEAEDLEVDESPLTGESVPVEKSPEEALPPETPVYERRNMVFAGTYVVGGRAKVLCVATGMETELGRIAASLEEVETGKTPLEEELDRFGRWIGGILLFLAAMVFALEYLKGGELVESLLASAALAVAAVPEGLPAIATMVLAIGALRMARRNAIVRKLSAIETLGSCNVICSDKTGTITRGEMRVRRVFIDGRDLDAGRLAQEASDPKCGALVDRLALMSILYADVTIEENGGGVVFRGLPTEVALAEFGYRAGHRPRDAEDYRRVRTLAFDRVRKRKSTIHEFKDGLLVITFGAPELLLNVCSRIELGDGPKPMDEAERARLLEVVEEYASQGLRTLGAAYKLAGPEALNGKAEEVESELTFLAILGISDPPREGVREAVEIARRAGIRVIMVTGDHEATAVAIAREVGIETAGSVTGRELDSMTDDELLKRLRGGVNVFARVTPEHKLRIVRLLKAEGYVVAMTGDGVNDAPALKSADVGVAMGIRGTDVTREVADLVLGDDNFVTIVEAVRQGRTIFENVKKPIDYLLSCNFGEVFAIIAAELANLPLMLTPAQLLWINLVTDALPALGLGMEPEEPGVMDRPPRGRGERLITLRRLAAYVGIGLLTASLTFLMYLWALDRGIVEARTMAFTVFSVGEILRALAFRSEVHPFTSLGLLTNKYLMLAVAASAALSLVVVYTPLASVFELAPLSMASATMVAAVTLIPLAAIELGKAVARLKPR